MGQWQELRADVRGKRRRKVKCRNKDKANKHVQDWLSTMNKNRQALWPHLEETYGKEKTLTWFHRWQIFYLACAELFAYNGGEEWGVCHYLFEKP